jgi:hypothetical protein
MAASTYFAQVQQLYIAYFGRPADPIGQAYWAGIIDAAGGNIAAVQAGFSASTESQALFGNKSTIDKVTAIYQNVFNRAPDAAGLAFWVAQIDSGKVSQAQASWTIQQNAGAGDAATVQNKLTAAQAFTAQIDTAAEIQGYQGAGAAAAGVAFLNTVTSVNATATAAVAAAPSAVAAAVAAGGTVGATTAFTAGVDSLVGTANNDTFVGVVGTTGATLGAADSVNGGAGVDTLRIVATTGAATTNLLAGVTVTNVEKLVIQNTAATAVTAVAPTGVTTVSSVNSTGNVAFTGLAAGTEVILSGSATTGTLSFAQTAPTDAVKVTIDGGVNGATVAASAGAATSAAINSTGAANGATTADVITLTAAGASLTTLAVNADTSLRATLTASDFATAGAALTVTGAAAVNLGTNGIYKTVDASASTGGLTIGLSAVTTSFKGSTGNDVVGGTVASTATVDAGAGVDTVVATSVNVGNSAVFKNFEQIELGGTSNAGSLDAALLTGSTISGVTISSTAGVGYALSNLVETTSGFNVGIVGDNTTTTGGVTTANALTLGFTAASVAGTSDVLNYNFSAANAATATTINGGNITSTGIETINISSKGGLNISNALTVTDNTAKSIVITGDHALALTVTAQTGTAGTTSQLTSIDGSAATAGLNITTSAATTAITAGLTIKGGAGNDTITVGTSAVATSVAPTITTGAGNDTVVLTAATAQSTTAPAFATITDFAKGDSLNFGSAVASFTKVDVSAASSFTAALTAASTSAVAGAVTWFNYGTDTYVFDNVTAAAGVDTTDIVVKLNGVLDLSKSTTAVANTVTFA